MSKLVIFGAGGHAKSLIDLIAITGDWEISGLVGINNEINKSVLGYKVKWQEDQIIEIRKSFQYALVAIGDIPNGNRRKNLVLKLLEYDFILPTIISPKAYVSQFSKIGRGTTIGHNSVINANASIGNFCIINTNSLIEHDVFIDEFCHISTSVTINGEVNIGKGSFLGSGSIIRDGVNIPANTVISAGKKIMGWPLK